MFRKKSYENKIYIREEKNGISVYDALRVRMYFYEDIYFDDVIKYENVDELRRFLSQKKGCLSTNVKLTSIYKVDWLISDKCNLDCIYCYADDKMNIKECDDNANVYDVIDTIDKLNPLLLGITGGEPLLCDDIYKIIKYASSKCWQIILDTNGTVDINDDLYKLIVDSRVLVRISVDSFNPDIVSILRPSKNHVKYLDLLRQNITRFVDKKLVIHTVVTKKNFDDLENLGNALVELGVKRWHIYGVSLSKKCSKIYEDLKISKKELNSKIEELQNLFLDRLDITSCFDDIDFENNIIVMADRLGRFYLDSTKTGINYIGEDVYHPRNDEIIEKINLNKYCECNLSMALKK